MSETAGEGMAWIRLAAAVSDGHGSGRFEGVTEAISEVGGFSLSVSDDVRLYMIETAQKGMAWIRLTATGTAGHGSMVNGDNAVTKLCEAVARLGAHTFPVHVTP